MGRRFALAIFWVGGVGSFASARLSAEVFNTSTTPLPTVRAAGGFLSLPVAQHEQAAVVGHTVRDALGPAPVLGPNIDSDLAPEGEPQAQIELLQEEQHHELIAGRPLEPLPQAGEDDESRWTGWIHMPEPSTLSIAVLCGLMTLIAALRHRWG